MLTPQDIHDKSFTKSFKGYDMDEVDIFLDQVIEDYDKLTRENKELQAKIDTLNAQIESYRGMENSLMHTMVTAHKAAEDIAMASKKESDDLLSTARVQSEQILDAARQQARTEKEAHQQELAGICKKIEMLRSLLEEFKDGVKSYADELVGIVDNMENPVDETRLDALEAEVFEEQPAEEPAPVEEAPAEVFEDDLEATKAIPGQRSFFKDDFGTVEAEEEPVMTVEEEWETTRRRRR